MRIDDLSHTSSIQPSQSDQIECYKMQVEQLKEQLRQSEKQKFSLMKVIDELKVKLYTNKIDKSVGSDHKGGIHGNQSTNYVYHYR